MPVTLSLTEAQVLTALRAFLMGILPAGMECIDGQDNRVPEPQGVDFVVMTPILRARLATTVDTFQDAAHPAGNPSGTRTSLQPTEFTVQLDIHGPNSGDNTQIITTLYRSEYATLAFAASGFDVRPLYTSEPRQMPFINAEQMTENRWVIDAVMQINPTLTTPQDFASALTAGIVEADTKYL